MTSCICQIILVVVVYFIVAIKNKLPDVEQKERKNLATRCLWLHWLIERMIGSAKKPNANCQPEVISGLVGANLLFRPHCNLAIMCEFYIFHRKTKKPQTLIACELFCHRSLKIVTNIFSFSSFPMRRDEHLERCLLSFAVSTSIYFFVVLDLVFFSFNADWFGWLHKSWKHLKL